MVQHDMVGGLNVPTDFFMIKPFKAYEPLCIKCGSKMRFSCKEIEKPGVVHDVFECTKCRSIQSFVTRE